MPDNSMQKRIMAAIVDRLETDKFEVVINTEYANTGTIWAVPIGQFTSRYSLHYQFNQGYCTFNHNAQNGSGLRDVRPMSIWYDRGEEKFVENLEKIIEFLEGEA